MWYDAMIESGPVVWQNQLNALNDAFFDENGGLVSDQFFINFFWNATRLINSAALAQALGRSEYKLYAGADVQANGYNTGINWGAVFPEGPATSNLVRFLRAELDLYQGDRQRGLLSADEPSRPGRR